MVHPLKILAIIWAAPWSLFGLCLIGVLRLSGASVATHRGTIRCYGPSVKRLLSYAPIAGGAGAITFGHTILAADRETFDRSFEHELVHVRQYERWGVFFVPAYLLASLWLMIRQKDYYRENPFEKPAFAVDVQRWKENHPTI